MIANSKFSIMLQSIDESDKVKGNNVYFRPNRPMQYLEEYNLYYVLLHSNYYFWLILLQLKTTTAIYNVYNGHYKEKECLFLTECALYKYLSSSNIR